MNTNWKLKPIKTLLPLVLAGIVLPLAASPAGDVKAIYEKECVHYYTDAKAQAELEHEAAAFKAIKEGLKSEEDKVIMQALEGATDDEIKGFVAHLRTFQK